MEALVREICGLKTQEINHKAGMDECITAVRARYEKLLVDIAQDVGEKMTVAQAWAEANPNEFAHLKSIDMLSGVVVRRTGNPALKTLRGWTWDRVLEKLKTLPSMAAAYIRTKEEVNKQAIIGDRDGLEGDMLAAIGVRISQEEEFFVDPKLTPVEKREVAA